MSYIGKQPLVTPSSFNVIASGSLSNGDPVCIKSDGTVVKAIAPSDGSLSTAVTFYSGNVLGQVNATYDSNAEKVVIFYRDNNNSDYGTAVVGTVSGGSISFGTPVIYYSTAINTGQTNDGAVFDSNSNKVVNCFVRDSDDSGFAVVGTVSGTSISFGSVVQFESSAVRPGDLTATFDSTNNKVVIGYIKDLYPTSRYPTAIVGTVSGTSISFGTAVTLSTADQYVTDTAVAFDANSGKVVYFYNGTDAYAYVGTVSGTSITFGSSTTVNTYDRQYHALVYDSTNQKVVFSYLNTDGTQLLGRVGTVSGSSISLGTEVVIQSNAIVRRYLEGAYDASTGDIVLSFVNITAAPDEFNTQEISVSGTSLTVGAKGEFGDFIYQSLVYDSVNEDIVIAYSDGGDGYKGKASLYTYGSPGDLTAENFIGFADADYADGATATVQLSGAVDDAQSGLTAGQQYFVQADGSLGTTADDPSVIAGVALSATEIAIDTGRD